MHSIGQEPRAARRSRTLGTVAVVFGAIAVALLAITAVLVAIGFVTEDPGVQMFTSLALVPLVGMVSGALGLVAVILAVITAVKTRRSDRKWIIALVLGVLGMLITPIFLAALFVMLDTGGFV